MGLCSPPDMLGVEGGGELLTFELSSKTSHSYCGWGGGGAATGPKAGRWNIFVVIEKFDAALCLTSEASPRLNIQLHK